MAPPLTQTSSALPPPRTEAMAIVSLVLAILSWFFCLFIGSVPAIILGHISRSKIRKSNGALQGIESYDFWFLDAENGSQPEGIAASCLQQQGHVRDGA
jgi:hypothetical protein